MKRAFTLAEVLITLGIIGIVAAMTMPAVINNTRNKQLETSLKKAYSILAQVTQRVVAEDMGGVLDLDNARDLSTYFVKYYKNSSICRGTDKKTGCPNSGGTGSNFCTFMMNTYKTFNGKPKAGCVGNDAMSNTIDNTTIYFDKAGQTEGEATKGKILMAVDVNGWQKNPNRWGHDIFMFQITKSGKLLPMGADDTSYPVDTYCSLTSTHKANGYGCTIKALNDKEYFKNLPK